MPFVPRWLRTKKSSTQSGCKKSETGAFKFGSKRKESDLGTDDETTKEAVCQPTIGSVAVASNDELSVETRDESFFEQLQHAFMAQVQHSDTTEMRNEKDHGIDPDWNEEPQCSVEFTIEQYLGMRHRFKFLRSIAKQAKQREERSPVDIQWTEVRVYSNPSCTNDEMADTTSNTDIGNTMYHPKVELEPAPSVQDEMSTNSADLSVDKDELDQDEMSTNSADSNIDKDELDQDEMSTNSAELNVDMDELDFDDVTETETESDDSDNNSVEVSLSNQHDTTRPFHNTWDELYEIAEDIRFVMDSSK